MQSQFKLILLLSFCFLILTGCDSNESPVAKYNDTNIKRLSSCYSMYKFSNGFKGPKSEEEFKDFLMNDIGAKVKLKRMGIDQAKVEDIFINERDGQPFRVRYGVNGGADANEAVVFEEVGVDGRRLVALNPSVECDEAEYNAYWEGKKVAVDESEEEEEGLQ